MYTFLIDTYDTERLKTRSVWSMFADEHPRHRCGGAKNPLPGTGDKPVTERPVGR